jgi:glycosyltransferase involved in cell wall biosynthesis
MSNPLVSVIIPAYNAEKSITDTLDSIFAQTYSSIEILVVDDGSTDKTAETIEEYQTSKADRTDRTNLIYIYQQNFGPSRARNIGIRAAKGEYIAFLDADDLWDRNKLDRQIELFKKESKIDLVFSDVKIARSKQSKIEETIMFQEKRLNKEFFGHKYMVVNPFEKLLQLNFIPTSSVIARKSCFNGDIFFNEERRYAEDWELWLRMSLCFNFAYVDEVCVCKKEKGFGLSADESEMILSMIEVIELFIKKKIVSNENKIHARYLKDTYKWAGYHFMLKGNAKLARELYRKSLKESFDLRTVAYYFKTYLHDFY